MYDGFDGGHDKRHMQEVRDFAVVLAKKYCPEKEDLAYTAATLHDIGLSIARENHEKLGCEIVKNDEYLKDIFKGEDFEEILEAIREHRASGGNPVGIVAKIVSDADKTPSNTTRFMQRAYEWGLANLDLDYEGQIMRAAEHLYEKFGEGGRGSRVYFPESREQQLKVLEPIFEAHKRKDIEKLEKILKGKL